MPRHRGLGGGKTRLDFPGGSVVKNLPVNAGTQVRSLGWEDPLEKEVTTHSSILAWKIPWTEDPGGLQSMGSQESDMTELTHTKKVKQFSLQMHFLDVLVC